MITIAVMTTITINVMITVTIKIIIKVILMTITTATTVTMKKFVILMGKQFWKNYYNVVWKYNLEDSSRRNYKGLSKSFKPGGVTVNQTFMFKNNDGKNFVGSLPQ